MKRCKFTLIELLIVITILLILVAILLPSMYRVKEKTQRVMCINGQRQIMTALINYCRDYEGVTPPGTAVVGGGAEWVTFKPDIDQPYQLGYLPYYGYINDASVMYCPTWTHEGFQYGKKYSSSFSGWPKPGETGGSVYWYVSYGYRHCLSQDVQWICGRMIRPLLYLQITGRKNVDMSMVLQKEQGISAIIRAKAMQHHFLMDIPPSLKTRPERS